MRFNQIVFSKPKQRVIISPVDQVDLNVADNYVFEIVRQLVNLLSACQSMTILHNCLQRIKMILMIN